MSLGAGAHEMSLAWLLWTGCNVQGRVTENRFKNRYSEWLFMSEKSDWGNPKPIHLKPGHLKMAFFSARCRLDGAFFV